MRRINIPVIYVLGVAIIAITSLFSCTKATVNFGEQSLTDDPNIVYIDSLTVDMATMQLDSFSTSGSNIFIVGKNTDDVFGTYEGKAYIQVGIPSSNSLNGCTSCSYDSLVFIAKFTGAYYGDTTEAFTLNVHQLAKQMYVEDGSVGYNKSSFPYDISPLGSITYTNTFPSRQNSVSIRLSESMGKDVYEKLKRNSDTINNSDKFLAYFKGLVLTGSGSAGRSLYYLGLNDTAIVNVLRLYYHENSGTPVSKSIDFSINPPAYTFNAFSYDRSGTYLETFTPGKQQIIESSLTGNISFLHANGGLYPRFTFPALFSIKELYPFIKVVKAALEIVPPPGSYGNTSLYPLPQYLGLYPVDQNNVYGAPLYIDNNLQTGDLVIDYLYHKDTKYTYDITSFVNGILDNGRFPEQALLLMPLDATSENRLMLNTTGQDISVKLKLYVLGL